MSESDTPLLLPEGGTSGKTTIRSVSQPIIVEHISQPKDMRPTNSIREHLKRTGKQDLSGRGGRIARRIKNIADSKAMPMTAEEASKRIKDAALGILVVDEAIEVVEKWKDINSKLLGYVATEARTGVLSPTELDESHNEIKKRNMLWEKYKGSENHKGQKAEVASALRGELAQYNNDRVLSEVNPNVIVEDPLDKILDYTDKKIGVLNGEVSEEVIAKTWWKGVRRNIELTGLRAEQKLRQDLNMATDADLDRKIGELERETKYFNWGTNRDSTIGTWRELASKHVDWLTTHDAEYTRAIAEAMAKAKAEVTGGQRFSGGFENYPISPPPAHYVAIFREGRHGSFEKQWGDKVKFLSVLNENDRLAWCYANMGAFANGVIQTKDWKGVVDIWLGDIKDSANLVKADREKMVGIKETEKDLRAMMALSASARAMEGSAGSAATYVKLLTVDRDGDLDKQDIWADFLLHDDSEKYWRVISQPLVRHYYDKILAQAGIDVVGNESGQTIEGKLRKVSSFGVKSDTALSSKLFDFLRQTEGTKYKGGFEPYISDELLVTDEEDFVSAQAKLGVDESARWSAARLACDAFMVDKLTRWESEIKKDVKYPGKTNIKPYAGWGGDPLILVLQPSFLSRVIKKVYSKEDKAIMDMADNAFRPVDIFDGLKGADIEPLPVSMVGHLKVYARYNDALWQFLGGSRAAGIPQWTNDTMAKTLPAIGELLDQVYGGVGKKDGDGKTDNTGKQVVGAMMARILECKALATAVESARPGFKDNLRILFNVGDPKEARPFLEVEKFIWGPDLDSKKGFLSSLVGGRTRFVLKDNKYGAETALKNTWEILNSNDQDPSGRGKAATLNKLGFFLDIAQALAKGQKR